MALLIVSCSKEEPIREVDGIMRDCISGGRSVCSARLKGSGEAGEALIVITGLLREYGIFKSGVDQKFGGGAFDSLMKRTMLRIKPNYPDYKTYRIEKVSPGRFRFTGPKGDQIFLVRDKGTWFILLEGAMLSKGSWGGVDPEIGKLALLQYFLRDLTKAYLPKSDSIAELANVMDEAAISFFYEGFTTEQKAAVNYLVERIEARGELVGQMKKKYRDEYCAESNVRCKE
jgi:hypothetical protein